MKAPACRIIVCNKRFVSMIRFQFYCFQINSFPRSGKLISLFGCASQTYSKVGISTCTLARVSHLVEDTCTCILRLKLYTCTLHNDYRTRSKCCVTDVARRYGCWLLRVWHDPRWLCSSRRQTLLYATGSYSQRQK